MEAVAVEEHAAEQNDLNIGEDVANVFEQNNIELNDKQTAVVAHGPAIVAAAEELVSVAMETAAEFATMATANILAEPIAEMVSPDETPASDIAVTEPVAAAAAVETEAEIEAPPAKRSKNNDEEKAATSSSATVEPAAAATQPNSIAATLKSSTVGAAVAVYSPSKIRGTGKRLKEDEDEEEENARPGNLRRFHHIPIFVVDYHNDVLEFIYRCLASRHLPLENNILIHFDSHPDMVISRDLAASASFDKETMLAELSIENWIMPACYAGHFNRVVWLKNSWCRQIPVGKYNFKIGHKNDKIHVDCPIDYFVSEGNYCETSELLKARDLELQVFDVDGSDGDGVMENVDPKHFLAETDAPNFILDIDLDFFSTANPFLEIYKDSNCYEQLTEIFRYDAVSASATSSSAAAANSSNCGHVTDLRRQQLDSLKRIFEYMELKRSFDGLDLAEDDIITQETLDKIKNLSLSLRKAYTDDEIDWLLIYDSGSTTDTNGLPHHVSSPKELDQYFAQFKQFLERLPVPPVLVTIACSAEDDYCPKHQVSTIKDNVLRLLEEVFGEKISKKPIFHYLDDEWDVMEL